MNPTEDEFGDDPRLITLARDYLAELEAGRRPDRREYASRFPELAAEVNECLDGELRLQIAFTVDVPEVVAEVHDGVDAGEGLAQSRARGQVANHPPLSGTAAQHAHVVAGLPQQVDGGASEGAGATGHEERAHASILA